MQEIIIADTSCLITLTRIGELNLLERLWHRIWITPEVAREYGGGLPDWIGIKEVEDKLRQRHFESVLDIGEASTIALALELPNSMVIIDEAKGRKVARENGVPIIGLLGILIQAKKQGLIQDVRSRLMLLRQIGFRFSSTLEQVVLKMVNEWHV